MSDDITTFGGASSYLYDEAIAFVIPADRLGVRCILEHSTGL